MPKEINPNDINLDDLNKRIAQEETTRANYQEQLQKAQNKVRRLRLWTIGVALSTIVLLAAAALLVLFFPPAAVIIPFFAAIGLWSPLLVLTSLLPSVGLGIASLVALRNNYKIQNKLGISQQALEQLEETRNNIPSSSGKVITIASNKLSNVESTTQYGSVLSTHQADERPASVNEDKKDLPRAASYSNLF